MDDMSRDPFSIIGTSENLHLPYRRCPLCRGETHMVYMDIHITQLPPPYPKQVENGQRLYKWQCMRISNHNGEFRIPKEINNGTNVTSEGSAQSSE